MKHTNPHPTDQLGNEIVPVEEIREQLRAKFRPNDLGTQTLYVVVIGYHRTTHEWVIAPQVKGPGNLMHAIASDLHDTLGYPQEYLKAPVRGFNTVAIRIPSVFKANTYPDLDRSVAALARAIAHDLFKQDGEVPFQVLF